MQNLVPYVTRSGDKYNIPPDQEEAFRADFGEDAQPAASFRTKDGEHYQVPQSMAEDFRKDFPDAQPVRRLSFANGTTRDFTSDELRKFFQDEYVTSPDYKQDRDEDDARQKRQMEALRLAQSEEEGKAESERRLAEAKKQGEERYDMEQASGVGGNYIADQTMLGAAYGAKKALGPYVRAFLTSPMRLMGRALNSGMPMNPSLAAGSGYSFQGVKDESGKPFIEGAGEIDAAFRPTEEEEEAVGAAGRVVGEIEEKAQTIGAFALALHNLGRGVGNVLMSAEAGNDTYLSLVDAGIKSGLSPQEADKWATGGSAVATLGTAALGALALPKFLQAGVPEIEAGVTMNGYRDLLKNAMVGNVKRYMINTAAAAGWQGGIMGMESLFSTPFEQKAQGKDVDWVEAWWNGAKSTAEGFGIGLFMGGIGFLDYKRGVRMGIEAQARQAAGTEEGRTAWRAMFPDGARNLIEKRVRGEDITRSDIERAGFPEMSKAERNAVADAYVEDAAKFAAENAERIKAEKDLRKGAQPTEAPAEPTKGEVVPVEPKPAEKPAEKPPEPPPQKPPENAPQSVPPPEGTTTPPEAAEPPQAAQPPESAASAEAGTVPAENKPDIPDFVNAAQRENIERLVGDGKFKEVLGIEKGEGADEIVVKFREGNEPEGYDHVELTFDKGGMGVRERYVKAGEVPESAAEPPPKPKNKGKRKKAPSIDEERLANLREYVKGQSTEELEKRLSLGSSGRHAINAPEFEIAAREELSRRKAAEPQGDAAQRLSAMSDEDIEKAFAAALGEKEAASEEGSAAAAPSAAPQPKQVNKGKGKVSAKTESAGTVPAPASEPPTPAPVNKGKGTVPASASEAPSAPKPTNKGKSLPSIGDKIHEITLRKRREVQAIAQQFGGDGAEDAVSALHKLFGASEAAKNRAKDLGMAAPQGDNFDENVYNTARPHFQTLLDGVVKSGKGVQDFIKAVADNFGAGALPYLKRFAADLRKGTANGQQGATGNRDGQRGGPDAADGRGASEAGGALPADAGNGGPQPPTGGAGALDGVRAGSSDGQGGGGRDGVRADGQLAGHEAAGGGGGRASGAVGDGLVSKDAGAGADAGKPSVVRAANGNLDTRNSPPVRLSKGKRIAINAQAAQLAEKPVGTLTDAEIEVLRQFTGAGNLGYEGKDATQQKAALNQHFTSYEVIDAMWNALEKAGVPMQKVLEPSAGSGNFPGRRPDKDWTLVELEPTTAKILKHLFPGAKIMQGSYEDVKLSGLDLAISNVPFLEQRNHPDRPDIKNLHDYFFAKAIDQVKPNGVVAFITSTGTMNAADSHVRQELVEKGDVIGAFRLPRGMFKANAGTEVTTDVIFIQRRPDGVPARPENAERNAAFVESVAHVAADGVSKMRISSYYEKYPEGLLGDLREEKDKMYGGRPKLELMPSDATDLSQIKIDYKPYPVAEEAKSESSASASDARQYPHDVAGLDAAGIKYELSDGNGTYAQNIRMYDGVPHVAVDEFTLEGYEEGTHKAKVFEPIGGEIGSKITELQHILDDAGHAQASETDEGFAAASRRGLEAIADYEKRFGKLPGKDRALKKFFKDHDEQHYLMELTAAANPDAAVWREKVRHEGSGQKQANENSSLLDQALASEDAHGEIDMGSDRCKVSAADFHDLLESGYSLVGVGTGGKPLVQNNVLFESGNIYAKIDFQKKLKAAQPQMASVIDRQIARLEKILPTPKVFDAIPFSGAEEWALPVLLESGINVTEDMSDSGIREFHASCRELLTEDEAKILSRHMSGRKLLDKKEDESDDMYLRREREAESSLTDIYAKVRGRIAEDPERVHRIEKAFNERFNAYVKPDFSKAEYLIADTVRHFDMAGFALRPNQKRWVTQALIEGIGINAHDVGGGKTMAALALAHALKARGVAKKPMFVVPSKTITTSWLNSKNGAQILFPDAKIVNLNNLPAETRARQLFDLANSNADFIFISHEGFESIQLPPEAESAALREFANSLIDATGDRREAMERDRLEAYIAQVEKEPRDTRLTFDKLGVDCIVVDEAHNFKNVGVSAPMERQGLGKRFTVKKPEDRGKPLTIMSHRAHDFRFKADWISDHNNGRNVFLLTATPTPNKPIELYTMLRHLGRRVFEDYGIHNDREFAAMFFQTGVRPVISTSGGVKNKEMITSLTNVYALKDIMMRYIDRIPMEAFAQNGIRLPKEKVEIRFVDMSADMEMVQDDIIDRVREASSGGWDKPKKGEDTVIGAFMNGRDAAVSPYVYGGPHAHASVADRSHDPRTDKIEYAVQYATHEVAKGLKDGEDPRCVLIFTDVMGGKDGKPSVPEDIKESLIRRGFDPTEIAIVTGSVITNPKTGREIQASGAKAIQMKGELADLFAPKEIDHTKPMRRDPVTGKMKGVPKDPKIKVMIGSTSSIGEGLNLDTWTSLAIHLDVPLTPGAIRQRRGRNIRFNNEHENVKTVFLMTRGSFDQLSYGLVAKKQGWNSAIWDEHTGDTIPVDDDAAGGGIDPRQIIIECERDPVRKQQMRVEYDLEARQTAIDQARNAVQSFADRIATQKRNAGVAQNRADERNVAISKSLREKSELEGKLPTIEAEIETARSDLAESAPDGEKELTRLIGEAQKAKDALEAAKDAVQIASLKDMPAAKEAVEEAKKANGAAREAVQQFIETLPKDVQPFARVYRNKVGELAKAKEEISNRQASADYSRNIVANAERDVKAANARAAELAEQSKDAEQALKDAIEARDALGKEWYDDFGTENQKFKFEKATLAAEMEAANKAEDDSLDWMDENQTLDAMPAPASTGSRRLNKGKLPSARPLEATGTAKPKNPTSPSDIFRMARELFPELKITNKGTYRRRGVLGWLEVENRVIRTVDPRAVGVLSHELGHAVARMGAKVKMPKDARNEFVSLGIDLYGAKRPAGGYAAEGFAEFVRGFLCDYDLAADYPNANKWFFEDFGGANPEFVERLFALKGKILEYVNMAPEQAIRSMWDHKRPMSASELPFIARARRYDWKTKWVDSNYPILRAMKNLSVDYDFHDKAKTPAERAELILNHPYMLATFFQGSALRFAEGDALVGTTDLYGDVTGAGLQEILSPIVSHGREKLKEFWDFAVAMRGADYAKKGMEFGRTRNEIAAAIGKYRSPENRKALQDITDWSHRVLHLLVDAGAITPDEYQQIVDANPVYVPIRRVFEEGEIDRARQKAGKRAIFRRHGGTQDIEHPAVALVEMAAKVRAVAQQAKVVQSLVDMYDRARAAKAKDINNFMVEVPNPVKRQVVWANKIKEQIAAIAKARFGTDEATIRAALKDTWTDELSVFSTGKYRGKDNIVTITDRSGKLRSFEVFDPAILELLRGYGKPPEVTTLYRSMQWFANGIRMGATVLKGSFSLVANPARDTATGFHMNEYGHFVPVWSSIEGMLNAIFNTDIAKTYLRLGGDMGRFYNGGQHAAAKEIAGQMQAANWFVRQWKKSIFQLVGDMFSIPEIGPRLIAFRNAKNHWMAEGVGETAANMIGRLCGGDITVDFGRAGTTARWVNRVWLFTNAAIRELDQLARASGLADSLPWQNPGEGGAANSRTAHAKRFFWRGLAGLSGLALVAYLLLNSDDKKLRRWRELKPEHKWNNTIFDFGSEDGAGAIVRLPVPFMDGLMFQSLPVAMIEAIRTGEAKPVNEVLKLMGENLPFSPNFGGKGVYHMTRGFWPSAAVPTTDLLANENFSGNEIVPARMERLAPEDQYGPNTTEFSKMMGSFFGVSPAKFEYLYDQYTGGLISGLIRDIESSTSKRGAIGVNGDLSKIPIAGRIFLAPFSSSRLPGDFYGELQELTAKHNSGRVTPAELGKLKAMEGVNEKVLSENAKMRRAVLAREDISAEEAKKLADGYAKDTIDTIRTFNGYAKDHDFRAEGIRAAVSSISNPGATDNSILRDKQILAGISLAEAQNALRVYGKSKGWSRETVNKRLRFLAARMR